MSVELRKPRATCEGLTKNKLDQVVINLTVNSVSTVSLSTNPDVDAKDKSVPVASSDIISELKTFQQKKFSQAQQDITVNIDDGAGGKYIWQGLMNGPAYSAGSGYVSFGINGISKITKLQQFKPDIYYKIELAKAPEDPITGTVPVRLRKILDNVIELWEASIEEYTDIGEIDKSIILAQHTKNKEVIVIWQSILDNSDDNDGLLPENELTIDQDIQSYIESIYAQPNNNFLNVMLQFCNDFKLTYIPPFNSDTEYGRLRGTSKLFESPSNKTVKITDISADIGNFNVPPIDSVWVVGPGDVFAKSGEITTGTKLYALYPEESTPQYTACTQRIEAPPWLKPGESLLTEAVDASQPEGLDPSKQENFFTVVSDSNKEDAEAKLNVLKAWAKLWYDDLIYANETVALTTPLDVTWEIGKYYEVKTDEGTLFKGLAANVRHNLSIRESSTAVQFSHVQY